MSEPQWQVPYRIQTERLVLRVYVTGDADALASTIAASASHLSTYMIWARGEIADAAGQRAWIQAARSEFDAGLEYTMGIFGADGTLLGGTGFHPRTAPTRLDIGFWLAQEHQGNGYITEAAAALTTVAIQVCGAEVVSIAHAPSNARSEAVARRLGFTRQDVNVGTCNDGDKQTDAVVWFAYPPALASGPLAAFQRPRAWDAAGRELQWPQ